MKNSTIDDSDLHYIDEKMHEKIKKYIISKDDLYMVIVGATIGKCGIVPDEFDGMNLTENASRIILHQIDKFFLLHCLNSELCQKQFIDKTKRVGVQKMALNRFAATIVPLPPLAEQQAVVAAVERLLAVVAELAGQNLAAQEQAGQLMQAVLKEAFQSNGG